MSQTGATGSLILPEGDHRTFTSELFPAVITDKTLQSGFVRDRYRVTVDLLDQDPVLQRTAVLDVAQEVWASLGVGEKVQVRLYQHPDQQWKSLPPREDAVR